MYMNKKKKKANQNQVHDIYCPYCHQKAVVVEAKKIVGDNKYHDLLYVCPNYPACNSYVGINKGTLQPSGSLANGDLRHKRILAHRIFDLIWKRGLMQRSDAYLWIALQYGDHFNKSSKLKPYPQFHIGYLNDKMCESLISTCIKMLRQNCIPIPRKFFLDPLLKAS